jgi:hypothetical protein
MLDHLASMAVTEVKKEQMLYCRVWAGWFGNGSQRLTGPQPATVDPSDSREEGREVPRCENAAKDAIVPHKVKKAEVRRNFTTDSK